VIIWQDPPECKNYEWFLFSGQETPHMMFLKALLSLYKIARVFLKPFKLRFWHISPKPLEALGPDLWKRSINGASSVLLAP
jgi:hypothetical protein